MSQVTEMRRVVVESLSMGAPAHEVVEGILQRSGAKPVRRVRRALVSLRAGDLPGGLRALGCGPLEVAVVASEPGAASRMEERLARLPAWFTFAQEIGGTAVYAGLLLTIALVASFTGARLLADVTGSATTSIVLPALVAAVGIVVTELLLLRRPWRTLQLTRAVAVASAISHAGSSTASSVALVDGASAGSLSRHFGALDRLDVVTLDRMETALRARYENETARAEEAMRVIGLALAGLPAVWVLFSTYGVISTLASGGVR